MVPFEREVQKMCRDVIAKHINDYSASLQIRPRLKIDDVRNAVWPSSDDEFDGDWRSVGVMIQGKSIPPAIRWWGFYCCLTWEHTDQQLYAWIGEWIVPRSMAERVFEKFRTLHADVLRDGKEVGLWQPLKAEEGGDFEQKIDALMHQWIDLWKKVGGSKAIFKE